MSIIGLDIGFSHIKAVSIDKKAGNYILDRYLISPSEGLASELYNESAASNVQIATKIKEILESNQFKSRQVITVLPEYKIYSKVITMPELSDNEFKKAIEWEAEQHIPADKLANGYLKYLRLDKKADGAGILSNLKMKKEEKTTKSVEVLLIVAPKKNVDRYLDILNKAGLEVMGMEPNTLSTIRSLQTGHDFKSSNLIINIGFAYTDIYLALDENLKFIRTINVGINNMANLIMKDLNVSLIQAIEYLYTYGVREDVFDGKIHNIIKPVTDVLKNEFIRSVSYIESRNIFKNPDGTSKVTHIVVTGGGAMIPDIMIFFANISKLEIQFANPFLGVDIQPILSNNVNITGLGSLLAPAVGAALKGL